MEIKRTVIVKDFNSFNDFFYGILDENGLKLFDMKQFIFRGEGSSTYKLLPTAFRESNRDYIHKLANGISYLEGSSQEEILRADSEYKILKGFYNIADKNGLFVPNDAETRRILTNSQDAVPIGTWLKPELEEIAALAQHYGLPTRLLDFSYDILTALYFASINGINRINKEYEKYRMAISNTNNMGNLTISELRQNVLGSQKVIQELKEVMSDKIVIWALAKKIEDKKFNYVDKPKIKFSLKFVVPPYANNPNLKAQQGVLIYSPVNIVAKSANTTPASKEDFVPLNERMDKIDAKETLLYKLTIPITDSFKVYEYVNKYSHSTASLFPDYKGSADYIKDKLEAINAHFNIEEIKDILDRYDSILQNNRAEKL